MMSKNMPDWYTLETPAKPLDANEKDKRINGLFVAIVLVIVAIYIVVFVLGISF